MTQAARLRYYPRHAGSSRAEAARAARPPRRDRHGARRLSRYVRPPDGQARRRELLPPGVLRGGARETLSTHDARRELSGGLSYFPDDERGAADSRDPKRDGGRRRSDRDVEGRMGPWSGGDQPPVCRGARDGRSRRALQARNEGDRAPLGRGGHLHGEIRRGRRGLVVPSPLVALGQDRPEGPLRRRRRWVGARGLAALRPLARGPARHGPRARVLLRAERELLQALSVG